MLAGEKPYSATPTSTVISLVSTPDRVLPLNGLLISGKYKRIITNCWRYSDRPSFKELLKTLENNVSILRCEKYIICHLIPHSVFSKEWMRPFNNSSF